MRTLRYILLIAIFLSGCKSAGKLVLEGNYDKAIEKSLKKAAKGKAKNDDYVMLDKAYNLANARDNEFIESMMAEGKPENWDRIYQAYVRLDNRQKRVRIALPFTMNGETVNYPQIDYARLKADSKSNAANYYYNHGNQILNQMGKQYARQAYNEFARAKQYNASGFPDIDFKLDTSRMLGTTYVNIITVNQTRNRFNRAFIEQVSTFDITKLESFWVDYIVGDAAPNVPYDFSVAIQIKNIQFSAEKESSNESVKKKQIEDGYTLKKDPSGKVMKDSLGKDIRIPKYKEVVCKYVERKQYKDVVVTCNLEYYDIVKRTVVKNIPFNVTTVFEHISAMALGDEAALEPEERAYLKNERIPFPNNQELLSMSASEISANVNRLMTENKNLIW